MSPRLEKLAVVTATLDWERARPCIESWTGRATGVPQVYVVKQDPGADGEAPRVSGWINIDNGPWHGCASSSILGVVPAFALGVQQALMDGADIIACFHDDLLIEQDGWDEEVRHLFKACPRAGLCGFGGGKGLGSDRIYQDPYDPMQLARQTFLSNMRHAEAHGIRSEVAVPVACLDGFSQIGLREFWEGYVRPAPVGIPAWDMTDHSKAEYLGQPRRRENLFQQMQALGVIHHFYDGMLGCYAKRLGYQVWFLPVRCHHFGGRTAVADARYLEWASQQLTITEKHTGPVQATGDQAFWRRAHEIGYEEFRDVLPIRT